MSIQMMDYSNEPKRDVLCVDVKSFFASVEAVKRKVHPLKSMIAVVSNPENNGGLVLAASPRVKEMYGIKTGSRVFEFPRGHEIEIVEPRMNTYIEANKKIIEIFKRFVASEDLMVYSIDESFLDVTNSHKLFGSTYDIAVQIQDAIWNEMGLITTIGIGDNPLLAKLCLDHDAKKNVKRRYISYWSYQDVPNKLWTIHPITDFWGIGKGLSKRLKNIGIDSIYDLSQAKYHILKRSLGVIGEELFFHAHGIDRTLLTERYKPKSTSFSKHHILKRDYFKREDVEVVIREMAEEVVTRLRKHNKSTMLISLSVGYSSLVDVPGFSRQMSIPQTDSTKEIVRCLLILFDRHYEKHPVRSIGVSLGKISERDDALQLSLFDKPEDSIKEDVLDRTIDGVRQKFGHTALLSASSYTSAGTAHYRSELTGGHKG